MSSIRCETRKRKIRVEGCVATRRKEYRNESTCWSESLALALSLFWHTVARVLSYSHFLFCTLVLFRACARVTTFAIVITSPLKPTFFFQAIRGHSVPEYRQIILCSCYRARMHSESCFALQMSNYSSYFSRRVVIWQCDLWRRRNKRDSLGFSLVYTIYKLATVINKCERRLKRVDGLNSQWSRRVPTYSTAFVRLLTNHRYDSADADSDTDTDVPTPTPTPTPTRPLTLHITGETLARIEINFRQQGETIEEKKEKEKISGICIQKHRTKCVTIEE